MQMKKLMVACAALGLFLGAMASPAAAKRADNQPLNDFSTGDAIGGGAHTTVQRSGDTVNIGVHSRRLTPGNAYTVWAVVFNTPGGCATSPCAEADLGNAAANPSVVWSGVGGVANGGGNLNGNGAISEGNPEGYQEILGGPGLTDADGAEVHMIVRDHGPYMAGLDQTTTFEGACTPGSSFGMGTGTYDCMDVQFSIHQP